MDAQPSFRDARFCTSVPCGWANGAPEEIQVFLIAHLGTMFLGISKSRRTSKGSSLRRLERPHLFEQTTPAFFYALDCKEHVGAFLETFRHLAAFAAAIKQDPTWVKNFIGDALDQVQLCQTKFEQEVCDPTGRELRGKGYEWLTLEKQDIFHPEQRLHKDYWRELDERITSPVITPDGRLVAQLPEKPPLEEQKWITTGHPWFFKIERYWITKNERRTPVTSLGKATHLTLPVDVVASLCEALYKLLTYYRSYVGRHKDQLRRHVWDTSPFAAVRKTQLYYDERAWEAFLPELKGALSPTPEPALWEYPHFYEKGKALFKRAKNERKENRKRLKLNEFNKSYLTRLLLFAEKKLFWRLWWSVPQWVAKRDVSYIDKLLWKRLAATTFARFAFLVGCCTLKREKVPRLRACRTAKVICSLLQHSLEEKLGYGHPVVGVARAPPNQRECSRCGPHWGL